MKFKALIGLLVGGAIAYSGIWYSMGLNVERQIVGQMDQLRELGISVKHDAPVLGGFPYRLEITLDNVSLNAKKRGWRIAADTVTAVGHVWTPDHWYARLHGAEVSAFKEAITLSSDDTLTSVRWHNNAGGESLKIGSDLVNMVVGGSLFGAGGIKAEKAELHLLVPLEHDEMSTGLLSPMMFKGNLRIAKAGNGRRDFRPLDRMEVIFALHGEGLDHWSEAALAAWRDAGGTLEISALSASWGASDIDGSASLSLDDKFMPLGAATVTLKNGGTLLKNLEKLDLLSDQPEDDSGTIALMAQSGELRANGNKIAKLKSVAP